MGSGSRSQWWRLVEAPRTSDPVRDLRADLLTSLELMFLALVATLGLFVLPRVESSTAPFETSTFQAALFLVPAVSGCVVVNRRGYTEGSARLFILVTLFAALWAALGLPHMLLAITIIVLVAVGLFPVAVAAAIGAFALLVEPVVLLGAATLDDVILSMCINGTVLALGVVLRVYQARTERYRVTEARALQERLLHSQRLDALGQLAGGVAHDFNNLLTAIVGSADLASAALDRHHPAQEELRAVLDATDRAIRVTGKLLAFSRRQVMQAEPVDLHAKVVETERLLKRLLRENIRVTSCRENTAGRILVDPVQLEQVIVNLALNAGDAMPNGGTLTLSTKRVSVADGESPDLRPGVYGSLSVSDTGSGIAEEVLPHIFEPFFTTKDQHRGTGLGLATVYGIMQQSGGAVTVASRPQGGAVFEVFFPATTAPPSEPARPSPVPAVTDARGSTIFVVEDDDLVRRLTVKTLSQAGYRVFDFPSGSEAVLALETYDGEVPLLLTDVVMLGMNGVEVARRFLERHSTTRVLLMSGYADEVLANSGANEFGLAFLEKPFTPARLLEAVRALNATATAPRV